MIMLILPQASGGQARTDAGGGKPDQATPGQAQSVRPSRSGPVGQARPVTPSLESPARAWSLLPEDQSRNVPQAACAAPCGQANGPWSPRLLAGGSRRGS